MVWSNYVVLWNQWNRTQTRHAANQLSTMRYFNPHSGYNRHYKYLLTLFVTKILKIYFISNLPTLKLYFKMLVDIQIQAKTLLKLSCYVTKSSLLNNCYIYILPIVGINAPYRFFFSLFFDWSFSMLLRWGMTSKSIPILQMKKRRHQEALWLAQGHQVCDQSGNSVPNHLPTSFSQNHQQ